MYTIDGIINIEDKVYPRLSKNPEHAFAFKMIITDQVVDGRWLLSAQHLECWRQLWAPQVKDLLPSLDLLVSKLITAETVLASYS